VPFAVSISCLPWCIVLDHGERYIAQVANNGGVKVTCVIDVSVWT
jgi:hypothetical protein